MVDDRPEDTGPSPEQGRAKRAPPTIDLEATEVSGDTQTAAASVEPEPKPEPAAPRASTGAMSAALIAAFSGASAAALVAIARLAPPLVDWAARLTRVG